MRRNLCPGLGHWFRFILNAPNSKNISGNPRNMPTGSLEHLKFKTPKPPPHPPYAYTTRLTFPGRSPRKPAAPWAIARANNASAKEETLDRAQVAPSVSISGRSRRNDRQRMYNREGAISRCSGGRRGPGGAAAWAPPTLGITRPCCWLLYTGYWLLYDICIATRHDPTLNIQ